MVVSRSSDHVCWRIIMAYSMMMFGNSLLESVAFMYLRITLAQYLAFNNCITLCSIDFVTEVVFGAKKMRPMAVNRSTCKGTGRLLRINANLQL